MPVDVAAVLQLPHVGILCCAGHLVSLHPGIQGVEQGRPHKIQLTDHGPTVARCCDWSQTCMLENKHIQPRQACSS